MPSYIPPKFATIQTNTALTAQSSYDLPKTKSEMGS